MLLLCVYDEPTFITVFACPSKLTFTDVSSIHVYTSFSIHTWTVYSTFINIYNKKTYHDNIKLKLPVLERLLSAIQPPFDINFPQSLGYIRIIAFQSPGETISLPVLCAANIWLPGIQQCQDTAIMGYQFTPWSSGAPEIHFLCQKKFILGQCRIHTRDLSICSRMHYHQTNTPNTGSMHPTILINNYTH